MKSLDLEWNEDLEDELNKLGAIRVDSEKRSCELVPDYKKKGTPLAVFGKHSTYKSGDPGMFCNPEGITIDTKTSYLYICDCGNKRVQVFNKSFQFLFLFSEKMNGPTGISIFEDKLYVTQAQSSSLNIYSLEGKLLSSVGKEGNGELEFNGPRGIAVSTEWRRIYVCEFRNHRVQSLNLDLTFNGFIPDIFGAKVVKLTPEEIVVLCCKNPCIRIYNSSHQLSREIISMGEGSINQVRISSCFILDSDHNILITDCSIHCVSIFSYTGELIHKFGKEGEEKGDFIEPMGITMDSEGRIVVVSRNPNNCVQVF